MASLGLDLNFGAAPNSLGRRDDPYPAFNFVVEIEGLLVGGFSECSGLQVETEFADYREGGVNDYVHRFAGPTKYPPLILKHGLSAVDGLWAWHQDIVQAQRVIRRNGTIYLLDRQHAPVTSWDFKDAFPVKWTGPDLRAEAGAIAIESIELAHRGLSRPRLASTGSTAAVRTGLNLGGSLA